MELSWSPLYPTILKQKGIQGKKNGKFANEIRSVFDFLGIWAWHCHLKGKKKLLMSDLPHSRTLVVVTHNLLPDSYSSILCSVSLRAEGNAVLNTYC